MKLIKKVLFLVFLIIAKVLAERKFFGTSEWFKHRFCYEVLLDGYVPSVLRFPGGINQDNGNFGYGSYQGYNWHRWNNNSINVNQKNGYNVGLGFGNNAFGNTGSRCRSNRGMFNR